MNRDDVTRMAREAEFGRHLEPYFDDEMLERFATLVAAAEREACAKVCDRYVESSSDQEAGAALNIQDEIRARSQS